LYADQNLQTLSGNVNESEFVLLFFTGLTGSSERRRIT